MWIARCIATLAVTIAGMLLFALANITFNLGFSDKWLFAIASGGAGAMLFGILYDIWFGE